MTKRPVALRIDSELVDQIDAKAHKLGMTRTDYMVRCALGEPLAEGDYLGRLDDHEQRLSRLEDLAYSS